MTTHTVATNSTNIRFIDRLNSWIVSLVFIVHLIYELIVNKIPLKSLDDHNTTSPKLLITFSGLGGISRLYNGLRSRITTKNLEWRSEENVSALRSPMHKEMHAKVIPMLLAHCERWRHRAQVALVGHSLGAVDAVLAACEVREKFGGKIKLLTVGVAGAFGTKRAGVLSSLGVHRTVTEAISINSPFLKRLSERSRRLPHHRRSEAVFVMSRLDNVIVPARNSLYYEYPKSYSVRHFVMNGVGHDATIMAAYPVILESISNFFV